MIFATVVPSPAESHLAKLQDLEMLVLFASREPISVVLLIKPVSPA